MPDMGRNKIAESAQRYLNTSLADALFPEVRQRVLGYLFGQPERSFYASELIQLVGGGSGAVQGDLARFAASGLVTVRQVGAQKHYQANTDSPIYTELCRIAQKTVGLAKPISTALMPIANQIRSAFVYGSVAGRRDKVNSDIDLMVIGDVGFAEVVNALYPVQEKLGREINPKVYTTDEWQQKLKQGNAFVKDVRAKPRLHVLGIEL